MCDAVHECVTGSVVANYAFCDFAQPIATWLMVTDVLA